MGIFCLNFKSFAELKEPTVVAEGKNAKKNSDRVLRAYYLDRDIDKALRRMALEEGKNLTESVNNALRAGLTKYL